MSCAGLAGPRRSTLPVDGTVVGLECVDDAIEGLDVLEEVGFCRLATALAGGEICVDRARSACFGAVSCSFALDVYVSMVMALTVVCED
jgi:hypothetical protein